VRFGGCAFVLLVTRLLQGELAASEAAELPIIVRDGLLWLEVCVAQSVKPLNFLVDTGASASVLNLSTARRLGLQSAAEVRVTGVQAKLSGQWPVKLCAKANQVELPREYLALDLTQLSGACRCSVDGLVGADFFRDRVIQIDYAAQRLRVLGANARVVGTNVIPLEIRPCGLRVPVSVNGGRRQWVRLDTGCATAFHWVTADVAAEECSSRHAVGLAQLWIPQTVTSITLGDSRVDGVPTGLHQTAIFAGESGLLGNGLLARFGVITIDAKSKRLILGSCSEE
jgi:hypothetical protein